MPATAHWNGKPNGEPNVRRRKVRTGGIGEQPSDLLAPKVKTMVSTALLFQPGYAF